MNNKYAQIFFTLLFISMFFEHIGKAQSQPCGPYKPFPAMAITDNAAGCAPLLTEITTSFTNLNAGSTMTIDWGDGSSNDVRTLATDNEMLVWTHRYPQNGNICEYTITAVGVENCGQRRSGTISAEVVVWDTDQAGLSIVGPYKVCRGTSAVIQFRDNSSWNCFPGTGNPNIGSRELQWILNLTGSNLQGVTRSTGVAIPTNDPGQAGFYPANNPGTTSDLLTVPATRPNGKPHQVGDRFYVRLNNWNFCNPRPAAAATTTSYIEIVEPPTADFRTQLNDASGPFQTTFCVGDKVYFKNLSNSSNQSLWTFYDDATGTKQIGYPSYDINPTFTFASPGPKLIKLKVKPHGIRGGCSVEVTRIITIADAPLADIVVSSKDSRAIKDPSDNDVLQFCEDTTGSDFDVDFTVRDVGNPLSTVYTWEVSAKNKKTTIISTTNPNVNDVISKTYKDPGVYHLKLTAGNPTTGCSATDEARIEVYSAPSANFDIVGLNKVCKGETVSFKDTSVNASSGVWSQIPGDTITVWKWYFNYNPASPGSPDLVRRVKKGETVSHQFNTVGVFSVRLQVEKPLTGVCKAEVIKTITVTDTPKASFTVDKTSGCADLDVTLTNTSSPQPTGLNEKYYIVEEDLITAMKKEIPWTNPSTPYKITFTNNSLTNQSHEYNLSLKVVSKDKCETISSPQKITVLPSFKSGFTSNYDLTLKNCTPVDVKFTIDALTMSYPNRTGFKWTIEENGINGIQPFDVVNKGQTERTMDYTFPNTTQATRYFIVTLDVVSSTSSSCVEPFKQRLLVNPIPNNDFTLTIEDDDCDFVKYKVEATQKGLFKYDWTLDQTPFNTPQYDDEFELVFKRPDATATNLTFNLSLKTTNSDLCQSPTRTPPVIKNATISKKQEVTVSINSTSPTTGCSPLKAVIENTSPTAPFNTKWKVYYQRAGNPKTEITANVTGGIEPGQTFSYEIKDIGTQKIILEATNRQGCIFTQDIDYTVSDLVTAVLTPSVTEGCAPLTVGFRDNSFNNSNINRKEWVINNKTAGTPVLPTQSTAIQSYTFENKTNSDIVYEVILKAISNSGCEDDSVALITVHPEPNASFDIKPKNLACEPYRVTLENTSNNPLGTEYSWEFGDGTTLFQKNDQPTYVKNIVRQFDNPSFLMARDITIKLTTKTPDGCITVANDKISLAPSIKAQFIPDVTKGCAPLTVKLENLSQGNDQAISNWTVLDNDTGVETEFSKDYSPSIVLENMTAATKIYTIKYNATSAGGCLKVATVDIEVQPQIQPRIKKLGAANTCSPVDVQFENDNIQPNTTYTWDWGDGSPLEVTNAKTLTHTFTNGSPNFEKKFRVILKAQNNTSSCIIQDIVEVTVKPSLSINVVPQNLEGCAILNVYFSNQTQGLNITHEWYYRVKGTNDQLEKRNTPFVSYDFENLTDKTIIYEVVYTAKKGASCDVSKVFDVTVYPRPKVDFDVTPLQQSLPNKTVTLTNNSSQNGNWEYEWHFGDDQGISKLANPGDYTYKRSGTYIITLRVFDPIKGCEASLTKEIVITPVVPEVDFTYTPEEGCTPLEVNFTNLSKNVDPDTYRWDFGDNRGASIVENPTYNYDQPGIYTVTLEGNNAIGLTVTERKQDIIKVYDQPQAAFILRPETVYLPTDPVFVNNYSTGATSYFWDFGDGYTSTEFEPTHKYKKEGRYTVSLTASNEEGCSKTLKLENLVTVIQGGDVKAPNVFSPSQDDAISIGNGGREGLGREGLSNDVFLPIVKGTKKFKMEVFNKWGQLLFVSKSLDKGWNGRFNGKLCQTDVYIYKLELMFENGRRATVLGDVTLLR